MLHRLTSKRHGRWEGLRHEMAPSSITYIRPMTRFFTLGYIGEVC